MEASSCHWEIEGSQPVGLFADVWRTITEWGGSCWIADLKAEKPNAWDERL